MILQNIFPIYCTLRHGVFVFMLCLLVILLSSCGLAQFSIYSSLTEDISEHIPKDGTKEEIISAASEYPDAALVSPAFYKIATPDDVETILQKINPTQITQRIVRDKTPNDHSFPNNFGSDLAKGMLLPMNLELKTISRNPLPVALRWSNYPEVIAMLLDAGCSAKNLVELYLGIFYPYTASTNVNSQMLALLLRYDPSPDNSSYLLYRLLYEKDDVVPIETVKVFLTMAQNVNINDDRQFVVSAVKSGSLEKLNLILAVGADPNYHWNGWPSALDLAQDAKRQDMVNALLAAGVKQASDAGK